MEKKPKVAFVCVHNSCRSQIAEALGKRLAGDVFLSYSAGTHKKEKINQDAVRLMKEKYHIDMEKTQVPKLLDALPEIDVLITMGCNVQCPFIPHQYTEDWGLDDPTGLEDEVFLQVMDQIEEKILHLKKRIQEGSLSLSNPH